MYRSLNSSQAATLLREGGVIAFPTDTVYGIGALYSHWRAIQRLFEIKGRPLSKPLIPLIASVDQAKDFAQELPPEFYLLAEAFWPGPLTIVLKKLPTVSAIITGGEETIGLRIPAHPLALELLREVGEPIVTTSANLSGGPAPACASEIDPQLAIDGLVVGDLPGSGQASTVLSLVGEPKILREGPISMSDIQNRLKCLQRA